jgi:hypothetical protein
MALRLISLLISVVLIGFLATTMVPKLTKSDPKSPAGPQNLLQTSAMVLDRTHQLTGSYQLGVQDQNGLRLAEADANGYCLELTWVDRTVWHLRGPGGQAEEGAC